MSLDAFKPYVRGHFNSVTEVLIAVRYLFDRHRDGEAALERVASAIGGPLIVGEAPGPNTRDECPMMPYPQTSAGGRLLAMSGLTAPDYLATFARTNLMTSFSERWSRDEARRRAIRIQVDHPDQPLILLGTRVQEAFLAGAPKSVEPTQRDGRWYSCLPHPSGRNPAYNSESIRLAVRAALWRMAELWVNPLAEPARAACSECGQLAPAHRRHAGCAEVRVLCPGAEPRLVRV